MHKNEEKAQIFFKIIPYQQMFIGHNNICLDWIDSRERLLPKY